MYIYESLTSLFNLSLDTSTFPDDWKLAKVSPVYKSGDWCNSNNYRPISVISAVARIFKKLSYDQLENYVTKYNLINPRQSGFRPLHSTATALLDLTNEWCFNIDRKLFKGALFLDLKTAFDTVKHDILLSKLQYFGLDKYAIYWFKSYLSRRIQMCTINGVPSEAQLLSCGVPRGTILWPLLFLIYVNDLPDCITYSTTRMYADDTNLTVSGCNIPEIQQMLQNDIQSIAQWLCANKLTLDVIKSEYMVIGSWQTLIIHNETFNLSVNGVSLKRVLEATCLGLLINQNLNWKGNVDSIIKKITTSLGIMKKAKPLLNQGLLINIYQSIAKPYFNYCSTVWGSIAQTQCNKLQKLQNRAACILTSALYTAHASHVFFDLGWSLLTNQRKCQKAIIVHKWCIITWNYEIINSKKNVNIVMLSDTASRCGNRRVLYIRKIWVKTQMRTPTCYIIWPCALGFFLQ